MIPSIRGFGKCKTMEAVERSMAAKVFRIERMNRQGTEEF